MARRPLSVFVAMPAHRPLHSPTVMSLLATQAACITQGIDIRINCALSSPHVECVRDHLVHIFLTEGKWDVMAWIDSDMVWSVSAFLRLHSHSSKLDCVGAAYVLKRDPADWRTLGGVDGKMMCNDLGCVTSPTLRFGLGFTMVRRKVMQELAEACPRLPALEDGTEIPDIFHNRSRDVLVDPAFAGEDRWFFDDIRALGHDVWLDPTIELGHVGMKIYSAKLMDYVVPIAVEESAEDESTSVNTSNERQALQA